jgi:hypothetical protein
MDLTYRRPIRCNGRRIAKANNVNIQLEKYLEERKKKQWWDRPAAAGNYKKPLWLFDWGGLCHQREGRMAGGPAQHGDKAIGAPRVEIHVPAQREKYKNEKKRKREHESNVHACDKMKIKNKMSGKNKTKQRKIERNKKKNANEEGEKT